MLRELHIGGLLQSLALGLIVGIAWGGYQGVPRPPSVVPGLLTIPRPDPHAVPLPRFPADVLNVETAPRRPWSAPPRPARGVPPVEPPVEPPVAAPVEPPVAAPTDAPPGDLAADLPEPSDSLAEAMAAFSTGYELYADFVRGDGDRTEIAPAARKQLRKAIELLESARPGHRRAAAEIDARIAEAMSYLGFLIHHGG